MVHYPSNDCLSQTVCRLEGNELFTEIETPICVLGNICLLRNAPYGVDARSFRPFEPFRIQS